MSTTLVPFVIAQGLSFARGGWCVLTRRHNAVEGHLAHDQEDDQGDAGPYDALLEGHFGLGDLDFGDERGEGLHEVEEADCGGCELASARGTH